MLNRRNFLALAAMAPIGRQLHAQDNWPNRPIHILSAGGPGGTNEVLSRHLAEPLGKILGQNIVIESKGGAGGAIGTQYVTQQPADGYTILTHHNGLVTTPLVRANPGYALDSLVPVSLQGSSPLVLLAHPSLPDTLSGFLEHARSHPGSLEWGTSALGGLSHLATEVFNDMANLKNMVSVPFPGSVPAMQALVGGHVKYMMTVPSAATASLLHEGRVRYLGFTYPNRTPSMPDVPAIAEAVPGFSAEAWYGMFVRAETPQHIVDKLTSAFATVLSDPKVVEQYAAINVIAKSGRDELAAIMQRETEQWGRVVRERNIRLD